MPARPLPVQLDAEHARFVEGAVSIIVAARDAANAPELVRAQGCRVSRDRGRVQLFVQTAQAQTLFDDLRRNGRLAVVFTSPSTHRSLQLKGDDASIARARPTDLARVAAYRAAMVAELGRIGISEALARALLAGDDDTLGVVAFTPAAAFVQTPGPDAGRPLGAAP
jgi:hypothetical protein